MIGKWHRTEQFSNIYGAIHYYASSERSYIHTRSSSRYSNEWCVPRIVVCGVGRPSRRKPPPPTQQQQQQSTPHLGRHLQYWSTVNELPTRESSRSHTQYSHLAANSQTQQRKWTWPRLDCCPNSPPSRSAHSSYGPLAPTCFFISSIMYSDVSVRSMNHGLAAFSLARFFMSPPTILSWA